MVWLRQTDGKREWNMKNKKRLTCALLAFAVTAITPVQAFAGPGESMEDKYDAETLARLQDNILEYDEIGSLVHEYNPNMQNIWSAFESGIEDMNNIATELSSQQRYINEDKEELKKMLGLLPEGSDQAQAIKSAVEGYDKLEQFFIGTAKKMRENAGRMRDENSSASSQIRQIENQVVAGCQQMLIGYSSIQANMVTLQKVKELQTARYELALKQLSLGNGTQTDVLSAQSDMLSAESSLTALSGQQEDLRRNLCMMTGWSADAAPEIRPIPAADVNRVAAINLEEDIVKAIGNNYTLISQRHSSGKKSTEGKANRMMNMEESEQKLKIKMGELYENVIQKKALYDAATTGYQNALLSQSKADQMYEMGMIGKSEYLGLQAQYLQKMAARDTADFNLFQALETYDWAVKGLVEIE